MRLYAPIFHFSSELLEDKLITKVSYLPHAKGGCIASMGAHKVVLYCLLSCTVGTWPIINLRHEHMHNEM